MATSASASIGGPLLVVRVNVSRGSFFFFKGEDCIRGGHVTGVQTCALPILFAPAGTPAAIVRRLHADTVQAMRSPETRAKLEGIGTDGTVSRSPEEFAALVRADAARYRSEERRAGKGRGWQERWEPRKWSER